jgi:hypothetical protein
LTQRLSRVLTRPVALPLACDGKPIYRDNARHHHAAHAHLMSLNADAILMLGHGVDLEALARSLDRRHGETDFGPERRDHHLLPAGLLHRANDARI